MKFAVCSAGPSLKTRWRGREGYDQVVVVNRAHLVVPDADWLSAGDPIVYETTFPPGKPPRLGALAMDATINQVRARPALAGIAWVGWSEIPLIQAHRRGVMSWSVQAGLCLAAHLGATHIDLLGADCAANVDCSGNVDEARTGERWRREESDLAATLALLADAGVTVSRIPP